MKIFLKNMVCDRCIMVVRQEFERSGITVAGISLGEVELTQPLNDIDRATISKQLLHLGFEILDSRNQKQIEAIKALLIDLVQHGDIPEHFSLSNFLQEKIKKDYPQISRLFSAVEGITIEQFYILQKTEKVKEWLAYDELTLSEIAWKLGYSSVAHLSTQFKKITGMTPSYFKQLKKGRKSLDQIR